jgi:uncharacterized protein YeaO (DUF488 family)
MIQIKRVYDPPRAEDGLRFLVDRLWPRGISKEALKLDRWLKDVAPSDGLRRWFGHDPAKWDDFCQRYFNELNNKPDTWQPIINSAQESDVTLLFSAKDTEHNNAAALKLFLDENTINQS